MFFIAPAMYILAIYVLAAVLPAVFLMRYIYRQDQIEPEPPGLLIGLIFSGVAAALCSIVLEMLAEGVLNLLVDPGSPIYTILLAFLVVAVVEEGTKLFFLKRRSWYSPAFNYRFDGVVYAVFVSLGFAAFENIKYVLSYGLSVAVPRALLAVPGHMGFAVFMGAFYGRARLRFNQGDETGGAVNMAAGYLSAVFLHGFYDTCAMLGTPAATAVFVVFVVVMYIVVIRLIRRESLEDQPLY
ncbi:PrsW family intramembrane metalloprotease [Dysosmobacter sp.]|uniref:PrsW family intramembrane metalloprotease n=1 Tax=Dysosmobacter sp. TaxID=2591382 RepID=UPI002A8DB625|nr:PrsW family intramembrane metalloprotease [Dysosmobacter sp.]MDY3281726.1 PrsW family intramembrane metalloprotease [Dysosmobacter sp.]